MKITYVPKNFRVKSMLQIEQANAIIARFQAAGYDLTLRQLYYQMVTKNLIPNTKRSYKNFGVLISDARLAGLIDWRAIVDRTRQTRSRPHWDHPREVIDSAYYSYNIEQWEGQDYRPRVWIEKDALTGVISGLCHEYDVPYLACKGYMSQSAMWADAQIALRQERSGLTPVIIHLGDHDPSGIQMTEDIDNRGTIFGASYEIRRIALNMDQIEELGPPPNPTKLKDSRIGAYIERFGTYESWELDALSPEYINELIRVELNKLIDQEQWDKIQVRLKNHKQILKAMFDNYDAIENFLSDEEFIDND